MKKIDNMKKYLILQFDNTLSFAVIPVFAQKVNISNGVVQI